MAITSGTYYFGPTESLLDLSAVASQINNQSFIGDVNFIQTGPIFVNSNINFNTINLNSHNLKFSSNVLLNGDPNRGYPIICGLSGSNNYPYFTNINMGLGSVIFDNLYFITSAQGSYGIWLESLGNFVIHDCLFKKIRTVVGLTGGGAVVLGAHLLLNMWNCKIWSPSSDYGIIATTNSTGLSAQIENVTIYNRISPSIDFGNVTNSKYTWVKNSIIYSLGGSSISFIKGAVSAISNASSDIYTTSADIFSFSNIIPMDHFISSADTSSDFLNLLSNSFLISAGTTPILSGNTFGIKGNLRPGDNYYSIGADEYGNSNMSFVVDKYSSTIPYYFRITDTSDLSLYTSATDYTRLWSIKNLRTNVTELFQSTSASMNYCVSADSLLGDTYTLSLSAIL